MRQNGEKAPYATSPNFLDMQNETALTIGCGRIPEREGPRSGISSPMGFSEGHSSTCQRRSLVSGRALFFSGVRSGVMKERLRKFAHRRPRTLIVPVLCVCILVSGVSYALYALLSKPEFPSEHTPLSLVPKGILWTAAGLYNLPRYSSMRFSLGNATWNPLNASQLLERDQLASVNLGTRVDGNLTLSLNLTETTGDGAFGQGDFFVVSVVNGSGFAEEVIYTLTVDWMLNPSLTPFISYNFVIDEGSLYAWSTGRYFFD